MTAARPLAPHGDMASCLTERCPSFAKCWRAQKPDQPDGRQSAMAFTPQGNACGDFIAIERNLG